MKPETSSIRTRSEGTQHKEHSVPLYLTSSFTFDNAEEMRAAFADEMEANIYSRFTNPNCQEFVDKMCILEGAEAGCATASGMAAVFASFAALLSSGDHVLACRSLFGAIHTVLTKILPKWGITYSYADVNDPTSWESLITDNTKMVFVETPSNPGVDIIDLEWLGALCTRRKLILCVDNCFATPCIQQPMKYGANLVIHSATKYLDGQGRVLGGVVVGDEELIKEINTFTRSTGPALSPFNAWIISKSLETLSVRMERHAQSALRIAEFLEGHEAVRSVKYPYLPSHPQHNIAKRQMSSGGGIVTFEIEGGVERGRRFLDTIELCSLTANLGDTRTIATHPASTTHAKLSEEERLAVGITPGSIRISVGLEDVDDIIGDVESALHNFG